MTTARQRHDIAQDARRGPSYKCTPILYMDVFEIAFPIKVMITNKKDNILLIIVPGTIVPLDINCESILLVRRFNGNLLQKSSKVGILYFVSQYCICFIIG